ncbi:hypothetical protein NW762_011364 [Fusarium torreyae]|uniref:Uncharacterized protein n=1 Tax=Fusarium torreyae TaxID=1237075 RepID=A0A9W8RRT2_9HYPO|nr:hypothetical protein NW762_011364 [Fusarium torreyae]
MSSNVEPLAQLWEGGGLGCTTANYSKTEDNTPESCDVGNTLFNISTLTDPFLAQLPNAYNTGLIRQFLPRISSTGIYENISSADFPNCKDVNGGFWAEYSKDTTLGGEDSYTATLDVQAYMPKNMQASPWNNPRDRQDFEEELYIGIQLKGFQGDSATNNTAGYYKIIMTTTAGNFELPNNMNDGVAGPLLDKDPGTSGLYGHDCSTEGEDANIVHKSEKRAGVKNLEGVQNKDPLLTIALALFGRASYLEKRISNPSAYGSYIGNSAGHIMKTHLVRIWHL